jgi:hypothetical protein
MVWRRCNLALASPYAIFHPSTTRSRFMGGGLLLTSAVPDETWGGVYLIVADHPMWGPLAKVGQTANFSSRLRQSRKLDRLDYQLLRRIGTRSLVDLRLLERLVLLEFRKRGLKSPAERREILMSNAVDAASIF